MSLSCKNLKFLRKKVGLTQEQFAIKLGIKRSLLGAYEEGRAKPKLEVIKKICLYFDISFEDLLLKNLSNSITEIAIPKITKKGFVNTRFDKKMLSSKNTIVLVPIKAAAGYLAGFNDEKFIDELNTFTLPMLASGNYRAFEIEGDSMLPTPSGSIIVGEKLLNFSEVKNANTYILVIKNQGIVYKRIILSDKKNTLTLQSDNLMFDPYSIKISDIAEIWKTTLIIQKPENKMPLWNANNLANVVQDIHKKMKTIHKKLN